jgi:hypothetical protein
MKKRTSLTLSVLVLILLVSTFSGSARAAEAVDVLIHNKNPFTITLTFVGLKIYQFELAPGKTTVQVDQGAYTTSYYGCGGLNFQDYTVKPKDNELDIAHCEGSSSGVSSPGGNTVLLSIRNHTFTSFPIYLHGLESNQDYDYTLKPGNNKIYVAKGLYSYSYYACSGIHYGTVNVPGRGAEMQVSTCSSNLNGDGITDNLTPFKVKNNTGDTVILVLNGIVDYLFTVTGSGQDLTVEKGYYQYTLYACGTTYDGVIQVTPNNVILRTPYCSK